MHHPLAGLQRPAQPPCDLTTVVHGRDLAVATSGTAERGHHIVDPRSGRPATGLVSITLVGRHLTEVDAMATAAFAMGDGARGWPRVAGTSGSAVRCLVPMVGPHTSHLALP